MAEPMELPLGLARWTLEFDDCRQIVVQSGQAVPFRVDPTAWPEVRTALLRCHIHPSAEGMRGRSRTSDH